MTHPMCNMTHPYVWHDLFICAMWFIHLAGPCGGGNGSGLGGDVVRVCVVVCCSVLQGHCSELHIVTVCCSVFQLQSGVVWCSLSCIGARNVVFVCCSVLQCVARVL